MPRSSPFLLLVGVLLGAGGFRLYSVLCPSGSPPPPAFHHAFPVHDLEAARDFYGRVLGLESGRSSERWHDYSLGGHQIVAHLVESSYVGQDYHNPVDGDDVPVPHFGLAMSVEEFHRLAARLKSHNIEFIIEPHLRFQGLPGEQWTMFFKDPSNNNLEFKAMVHPENLFAKYVHVEKSSAAARSNAKEL